MLAGTGVRLAARLVPRVRAAWPAIGAIALAVVLAHSGVQHLDAPAALALHYRTAIGTDAWTRGIGIAQLFAAGGLLFPPTRLATACVLGAVLVAALGNQWLSARGSDAVATAGVLAWTVAVAWGESRRTGPRADR
ncbi:MAG: hypothetical protein U1F10_14105 [Burkholderiales bacterium]